MDPTHPEVCKGVLSCWLKVTRGYVRRTDFHDWIVDHTNKSQWWDIIILNQQIMMNRQYKQHSHQITQIIANKDDPWSSHSNEIRQFHYERYSFWSLVFIANVLDYRPLQQSQSFLCQIWMLYLLRLSWNSHSRSRQPRSRIELIEWILIDSYRDIPSVFKCKHQSLLHFVLSSGPCWICARRKNKNKH